MASKGSMRERFIEVLNAVLPESWQVNFREAYGQQIDPDEQNWRALTGDARRDLPFLTQERMQKIAHWLWEQNPLANRLIELPVAYLLAEGVQLSVQDPENQKALDRFWKDPINDMNLKLPKKVRELAIFGEQLYPAFVNEIDGMVRIGYIDPSIIGEVVKDPDNSEQPIGVVTKRDMKGRYYKYRVIINGPEEVFTARTQAIRASFADGEAFYFRVNDLSAGSRGRSDLLHEADWLDAYDQFLFGEADRYKMMRAFLWDLMLKGATPDEVKARARTVVMPQSGGVYVHNDSETLEPKTPDLLAQDTTVGARLLRNHILGGASIPEHWFGGGGDVNRATAAEMGDPAFKVLAMRQRVWKHILESMGRYVLYRKAAMDGVQDAVDWSSPEWSPQAVFPELAAADIAGNATALQQVVTACGLALDRELVTKKLALQLIDTVAGRLGVEIDAEKELEAASEEAAMKREQDVFTSPPGTEPAGAAAEAAARMQEAVELIRDFHERDEERLTELARLAGERQDARAAKPDPFVEAIGAAIAEQSKNTGRLVEALGKHVTRHQLELTLKHGKTKKTITAPDGRKFEQTEEDA